MYGEKHLISALAVKLIAPQYKSISLNLPASPVLCHLVLTYPQFQPSLLLFPVVRTISCTQSY
jgi:hypothetical protein